ncbi:MAG: hypothetical protein LBD29_04910, partial [Treponema sp.]|nr:hypothetical protein [Treponema sp.]
MSIIQEIINSLQTKMVALLGETWIANGISLIMGVLGTIAFFMQMPRKIKPIAIQYGDIALKVEEINSNRYHWIRLTGIELFLSLSNLKNAVGIIEDIFVRIYTTESYNPETDRYHATTISIDGNEATFVPFVLSPNSHISI